MFYKTYGVKRALLVLIILTSSIFGLFNNSSAQIIIRERMELKKNSLPTPVKSRSYIDGRINGLFPRYSGNVTLRILPYTQDKLKGEWSLYESNYGKLSGPINWNQGLTVNISGFKQWQKLDFYLRNQEGTSERHVLNSHILESNETRGFFFKSIAKDNPESPGIYSPQARATLSPDSLKPAIPGPEVFYLFYYNTENPYKPTRSFAVPDSGLLIAKVKSVRDNVKFELHTDLPDQKLLADDLKTHEGDTLWIGYMTPGETFRLFIKSNQPGVQGTPIYPLPKGETSSFGELVFEGWTDLQFDDIEMELYLGHHPKEPAYLDIAVEPDTLAPGDTALVKIVGKSWDGETITFNEDHRFDVELNFNEYVATLLHPNGQDTADVFKNFTGRIKVIAKDPNRFRPVFSSVRVATKADGPYVKNKRITGRGYFDVVQSQLEPCKSIFPDINAKGERQPGNWEECDRDDLGTTSLRTENYIADIKACFSGNLGRWKGELLSVDVNIKYGLCPLTAEENNLEIITNADDSGITEQSYCSINNKIQATISALEKGGKVEVYYPQAVIIHEKKHVEQITGVIDKSILTEDGLLEQLKADENTLKKNEASNAMEAQKILDPIFTFLWNITKIDIGEELIEEEKKGYWEKDARDATVLPYVNLLEQIQERASRLNWKPCTE